MIPSRREALLSYKVAQCSHAGLWFERYLETQSKDDTEARRQHVLNTHAIKEPAFYKHFFESWEKGLNGYGALTALASVQGRMVVGLGSESLIETGMTLHKTYGVPYIPGSALKGLVSHFAANELADIGRESAAFRYLFGETEEAGNVTFFDALYKPNSGRGGKALWPDVMTVHHADYYGSGKKPPADWDSPNPVPLLSATGEYLIALKGEEAWVRLVMDILKIALMEYGIGGKTAAGYGHLLLNFTPPPKENKQEGIVTQFEAKNEGNSTIQIETDAGSYSFEWKKKDRNKLFSEAFLKSEPKQGQVVLVQWRERDSEDGKTLLVLQRVELAGE